ncbi:MAG: hypothetical protein U0694_04210 [Anaerolineae bacterium]
MASRVSRLMIEEIAKHLPPSASSLQLVDVNGAAGTVLAELRGDLTIIAPSETDWNLAPGSVDAVVAYGGALDAMGLQQALDVLRPGGRLIMTDPSGDVDEQHVKTLEDAGYTRILVSLGVECPTPLGVMMRGEKPHVTADTLERVQSVADKDDTFADLNSYSGRYIFLLIQQTPNKPVWALQPDEQVEWQAVALDAAQPALLAFSSLPRAVAFMQPAVLAGQIKDVNKVAKFSRETALAWTLPVVLNPDAAILDGRSITHAAIDPSTAETPDE